MKFVMRFLALGLMVSLSSYGTSGEVEVKEKLEALLPGIQISRVELSEIGGLYRVDSNNGQTIFTNADASYFLTGDMYSAKAGKVVNLTEARRGQTRAVQIAAITEGERIIFPAQGETKAKIAVFTDIDCGYCRKLHQEVPRMNELGIEVSYLAYPRAGVGSDSYNKFVSAWCSSDKKQAMTDAKAGKQIASKTCANPVAQQFELGQAMGVTGTPAIVLDDGTLVPGYMPADQLAKGLGIL